MMRLNLSIYSCMSMPISKGNRNIENKRVFKVTDLSKVKEIHSIAMMIILIESETIKRFLTTSK